MLAILIGGPIAVVALIAVIVQYWEELAGFALLLVVGFVALLVLAGIFALLEALNEVQL